MQLKAIQTFSGLLELLTGLHIGTGNSEMHIGGTDNPVNKHPITQEPYIPGSSIKGKMRSLLEWKLGVVGATEGKPLGFSHIETLNDKEAGKNLLKLFGGSPEGSNVDSRLIEEIGPTRLSFWDCPLDPEWVKKMNESSLPWTETKMENMIDRIQGVAQHPRSTERVPAGAKFCFKLTLRVHEDDKEDLKKMIYEGLKLVELTGLGGSGSRGYGKVEFQTLYLDGTDVKGELSSVQLGAQDAGS